MYNWFNYSRVKKQLESQLAENAALREEASDLASGVVNGVYEIIALKNELQHQLDENAKLLDEKKNLEAILKSIEEDGTEEHNNAVALRQEIAFLKAKYQVISNDYKKCAEERDEYKHQLNAANKEIEVLKSKLKT